MNKSLIVLLSFVLCIACNKKVKQDNGIFDLHGKITGYESGMLVLNYFSDSLEHHDSIKIVNGEFKFSGKINSSTYCYLMIPDAQVYVDFFADPGAIEINGRVDSLDNAIVTAGESQEIYRSFKNSTTAINNEFQRINYAYYLGRQEGRPKEYFDSLDGAYKGLERKRKETAKQFVFDNKSSSVSPWIILNVFYNSEFDELEPLYSSLDDKAKSSSYGKQVEELVQTAKNTAVGSVMPDFSLNDTSNQMVTLSSYAKGNVTLIDFWASWCGPCRRENPDVVKTYTNFSSKGFKILGVSLDEDRERWIEAIKIDGLAWTHVSDLKGWNNVVAKQYGIRSIPANFLLDRNGKIFAKNLHGKELEDKVAEAVAAQ